MQVQELTSSIIVSPTDRHSRYDRSGNSTVRGPACPSLGLATRQCAV